MQEHLLIVGLGNPGEKYALTRHNIGFIILDRFVQCHHLSWEIKKKSQALCARLESDHSSVFCLKPQTFMNCSGESVVAFCKYHTIHHMLVIHDDLDLCLGAVRFKLGGSSGGHNGLKSIDSMYGNEYLRMRCGIGKPPISEHKPKEQCVIEYVLGNFSPKECETLETLCAYGVQALDFFVKNPAVNALQNTFNTKQVQNL